MNTMTKYPKRMRGRAALAAALILLAAPAVAAAQAAVIDPSLASNGGDTRDLVAGDTASGEMYSTIGEPVAEDSINTVDNETTWTGFWQVTPIGPIAAVQHPNAVAENTGIVTTLPDPFTAQVEIRLTLQNTAHVRLEVYDLLGQYVGTLLDEPREEGLHRIAWRPDHVPAGAYMLLMNVDDEPASARLIRYAP